MIMTNIFMILQIVVLILMVYVIFNSINKQQNRSKSIVIDRENTKELNNLIRLRQITLSEPLTERSRPTSFEEIVGQEKGIRALKAALCGPNPQHVIIYGPPGLVKQQQQD